MTIKRCQVTLNLGDTRTPNLQDQSLAGYYSGPQNRLGFKGIIFGAITHFVF